MARRKEPKKSPRVWVTFLRGRNADRTPVCAGYWRNRSGYGRAAVMFLKPGRYFWANRGSGVCGCENLLPDADELFVYDGEG